MARASPTLPVQTAPSVMEQTPKPPLTNMRAYQGRSATDSRAGHSAQPGTNSEIAQKQTGLELQRQGTTQNGGKTPGKRAALLFAGQIWILFVAVILAGLIIDATLEHRSLKDSREKAAIDRVLLALQAGIDARTFPDAAETARLGKEFILHDVILGGSVVSVTGEVLASFGEPATLRWEDVHINNIRFLSHPEEHLIDVALKPLETGLSYEVILRIPGPGHPFLDIPAGLDLSERGVEYLLLGLAIATVNAAVVLARILIPLSQLQQATGQAASTKIGLDQFRLKWRRKDLIGAMGRNVDALISRLHFLRETELAPLRRAQQRAQFAIVQLNSNGRPISANEAAVALLQREHASKIRESDLQLTTLPQGVTATPGDLARRSTDGCFSGFVSLKDQQNQTLFCMADIAPTAGTDAIKTTGHMLILVNVTDFFNRLLSNEAAAQHLDASSADQKRRELVLDRQIRALRQMASVSTRTSAADKPSVFVSVEQLIQEWYLESREAGAASNIMEHEALEPVAGQIEEVRGIFHQVYSLLYLASGEISPQFFIQSRLVEDGLAEYAVEHRSTTDNTAVNRLDLQHEEINLQDNRRALALCLQAARGSLVSCQLQQEPMKVVLRLPAFRSASQMTPDQLDMMQNAI